MELSGRRWAEVIHDILKGMGFLPSKVDSCIWMRKNEKLNCYEYIAVYVDDLVTRRCHYHLQNQKST